MMGLPPYILEGEHPYGREVRVTGTLNGHTITPETIEAVELSPEKVLTRCRLLKEHREQSTGQICRQMAAQAIPLKY